jgi:PAS domain S-box-containing protein
MRTAFVERVHNLTVMPGPLRDSGIAPLGQVPWGTHLCLFYETVADLTDVIVPYLAAGLEKNELCFWLVAEPLTEQSAKEAFRRAVPDLDRYEANGAVRFAYAPEWLLRDGRIEIEHLDHEWLGLLTDSEKGGFAGLRAAGCQSWLQHTQWNEFHRYERALEEIVCGKAILALCSYPLQATDAAGILDVADSHDLAIAKREGKWEIVETPTLRLQQLAQRNRQQAAISKLGVCAVYERNIGVVINQTTALAAETLDTGRSLLWQLRPEHDDIVLRSKAGWDDLPEETVLPLGNGAVKQAIERNEPVTIFDIQDEHFEKSWILRDYGVATMMTAIIRGQERPWGILSVHSLTPRSFSRDDLEFLQSMADMLALAIERDRHEAAERREKETLQTIFDNVPVMISFRDPAERLVAANPEWQRAMGWTAAEAARTDIFAELFPDEAQREFAREFISRPDRGWRDFQVRTREGQFLETSWARFSLSDHSSILVALDVTKRKRAEEHFRELAENINESFWVLSGDREQLLYLNPAGERLSGHSQLSLSGPRGWLKVFHPDDREKAWSAVSGEAKAQEDLRIVRPNGTIRWGRLRATWIRGDSGEVFRVCGITTDVTDRREAENERARLLAVAEKALQRLHAIESITDTALGRVAFDELLSELLSRLRTVLQTDEAGVVLLNEQRTAFVVRASDGTIMSKFARMAVPLDSPIAGRVLKEGRAVIVDDVASANAPQWHEVMKEAGVSMISAMGAPMMVEGTLTGVVVVVSEKSRKFTEDDLDLLRVVADRVAPVIERNRLMEIVRAGRERLELLSRRLLTVQEEQRRRVAIELHDELGQILTAVKIDLQSTPAKLADAVENVDRAMKTVRDLALELRPAMLDDLGLAAALRWYADRFAQQTGVTMHIAIEEVCDLTFERATSCFRVAQEALTNIARHAAAKNVWLDLHRAPSALELSIRDDGMGFDVDAARERAAHGASLGIVGMQERASLAGGTIEIRSTPGKGTEIRARFPIGDSQ